MLAFESGNVGDDRTGAEITPEESSVRGEDGGEVHLTPFGQGKSNSGQPLMEVGDNCAVRFAGEKLEDVSSKSAIVCHQLLLRLGTKPRGSQTQ